MAALINRFILVGAVFLSFLASIDISADAVTITLRDGPGNIVMQDGNKVLSVNAGDSVSLLCSVHGSRTSGVWYHNNMGLSINDMLLAENLSEKYGIQVEGRGNIDFYILEVRSIGEDDQGHYLCRSGSDDDSVTLTVTDNSANGDSGENANGDGNGGKGFTSQSTDGRVEISSVTPLGSNSIKVTWKPDTSMFDGYVIYVSDTQGNPVTELVVAPSLTSATLSDLQPVTSYVVAIHIFVGQALGQQSDPVSVTTLEETAKPQKGDTTVMGKGGFKTLEGSAEYGQKGIRVMRMRKEGDVTYIKEVSVDVMMRISVQGSGENSENGAYGLDSNSMKNRVHMLAKANGIQSPEQFAQDICRGYNLNENRRLLHCAVYVEEFPWTRMEKQNHAFISNPEAVRFAEVYHGRGELPKVISGLKNLRILKTDSDQIRSGDVSLKLVFAAGPANYDDIWESAKNTTMVVLSGPRGTESSQPSADRIVQKILAEFSEITYAEIEVHRRQYSLVNVEDVGGININEVYEPMDTPYSIFKASLIRPDEEP